MAPNDKRQGQDMYERVRREENDFYSCFINDLGGNHSVYQGEKNVSFYNFASEASKVHVQHVNIWIQYWNEF